jgi:uncharacterized protein YbdZ (MbtH family)
MLALAAGVWWAGWTIVCTNSQAKALLDYVLGKTNLQPVKQERTTK